MATCWDHHPPPNPWGWGGGERGWWVETRGRIQCRRQSHFTLCHHSYLTFNKPPPTPPPHTHTSLSLYLDWSLLSGGFYLRFLIAPATPPPPLAVLLPSLIFDFFFPFVRRSLVICPPLSAVTEPRNDISKVNSGMSSPDVSPRP